MAEKTKIVAIVGPTASGKTSLAIALAKEYGGEIVSCDSMQIYRRMNIGTAKPTVEEMQGIPHHLIDIKEPWESFSAAEFKHLADMAIADIHSRGKLPIIVGGTGFYINGVLYEYHFGEADTDEAYRARLEQYAAENGNEALWNILNEKDPDSGSVSGDGPHGGLCVCRQ